LQRPQPAAKIGVVISFIIPAHNEEALIGNTLAAIRQSASALGEPHEIIVANDASTDSTGAIALEHGARVVAVDRRQIAAARNAGARVATGDVLIFVDADTIVPPRVLRAALRLLRSGAVGGGCCIHLDGRLPPYGILMNRFFQMAPAVLQLAGGCFLYCTRQAYLMAGGFNEAMFAAEEVDFSQRLKRQGRFVVLHERVITSGRKIRAHSALQILRLFVRLAIAGPKALQRREGLELWYGPRAAAGPSSK
jgi:glycosyltransferase involved in cell wall biosynthesis